jgi:hypothetical protein
VGNSGGRAQVILKIKKQKAKRQSKTKKGLNCPAGEYIRRNVSAFLLFYI